METQSIIFTIFLIFTGAAVMSTAVLYTRQSLLVAYILLGLLMGPWLLNWVGEIGQVKHVGEVGIIFLLFLLGLHLQPQNLLCMLQKVSLVAIVSSLIFLAMGFGICYGFGFSFTESLLVGSAIMFSSTIIGLKLLPTTILHHQHTGEMMISVLLMQDIIAIILLIVVQGMGQQSITLPEIGLTIIALPVLVLVAFFFQRFILVNLIRKFDRTQEYIFMLSIGWCLGMAQLGEWIGLSADIGAFVAGVALAANPISLFIAESLKPVRDFFLVMFFFAIGAAFDFSYIDKIWLPALLLSVAIMIVKPLVYAILLRWIGEKQQVATEVGVRLGQASEFTLFVGALALSSQLISAEANYLIQAATLLTFIASSYWVVLRYPTPIAISDKMRQD